MVLARLLCLVAILPLWCLVEVECQQRLITLDGNWSPWSTVVTDCIKFNPDGSTSPATCGGGTQQQYRSCTNPKAQGMNPKPCPGDSVRNVSCNTVPCNMQWASWAACSATCGRGFRSRYTLCAGSLNGTLASCATLGMSNYSYTQTVPCNTWNKATCPSPCIGYNCPVYADCADVSTDTDPATTCTCQMGRVMSPDNKTCDVPPTPTNTPRPNPSLAPAVKTATTVITKTASTILIIFVGITLFLFASLRIFDDDRVIQMNMEIALILAHICLLFPALYDYPTACKVISILTHFFFTACFMFMLLESLFIYSLVAFVVKRNGMLAKWQNFVVGWGVAIGIILLSVGFEYDNYGGEYHCWLQINTDLVMFQFVPFTILVILIFTLVEAAGAAEYRRLPGLDQQQLLSAKIMQRSILIIMPLVYISYIIGAYSEYDQNVSLYSIFTILNGVLGACVFFFHCTGNEKVRAKLSRAYVYIFKRE